ncbi:unnamed protein product [Rhizopus stolonifer]
MMMRTTKFVWAACLSALIFILTLVVYTTSQSISVQLQFNVQPTTSRYPEEIKVERYITYYPHSGLHNQRLALINAIVLAKVLNRTLIVPEMNIGKAVAWNPADRFERKMSVCPNNFKTQRDCFGFRKYVPLPAEAIFDLSAARANGVRLIHRANMSESYFEDAWSATEQDMYRVREQTRFSYRIFDTKENNDIMYNFTQRIDMQDLATRKERFMVFGSLHYTNRLALSDPQLNWFVHHLREEVGLGHPVVNQQALKIVSRLGGPNNFVGVHLRQGDGFFKKLMTETITAVRLGLEQDIIPYMETNQLTIPVPSTRSLTDTELKMIQSLQKTKDTNTLLTRCLRIHHPDNHPRLRLIYMATDTPQPRTTLKDLHQEFPCIFTLSDFPEVIQEALSAKPMPTGNEVVDREYARVGTGINSLLIPMIDAEITSHASAFVGTRKSTFSGYIIHRLNRLRVMYATLSH